MQWTSMAYRYIETPQDAERAVFVYVMCGCVSGERLSVICFIFFLSFLNGIRIS